MATQMWSSASSATPMSYLPWLSNIIGELSSIIFFLCEWLRLFWGSLNVPFCSDVHGNMDRLVCQDCGKLFTSKRSLFGHKKEKHSGPVEVFPCVDCGKNFSRKANLKVNTFAEYIWCIIYKIPFRLTEIPYILGRSFHVLSVKEYLPIEVLWINTLRRHIQIQL